jgi:catechol 2,3-dioxygenase-like lactoylglutathione lyase family enzyme
MTEVFSDTATRQVAAGPLSSGARIMAFIVITQPDRAIRFYRDTLGLRLVANDGFALIFELQGTMIRAGIAESVTPTEFTALGWEVENIAATAQGLQKAGIQLERLPGRKQDELGIWTAPNGSQVAWFRDPDGNWLSISHHG